MRTVIPKNNVDFDYYNILDSFISLLYEKQKDNIKCIYLCGSYARGDATNLSDLDLFCVFNTVTTEVMNNVGFCCRNVPVSYNQLEINTQCLSINEFNRNDFKGWTEKSVRILDSVLLYGEDIFGDNICIIELQEIYRKYFIDVLMSIRHYINVDEPAEQLTHKKIKTYILKPLLFPLRIERYCNNGTFPLSTNDLMQSLEQDEKFIIDFFCNESSFSIAINQNHKTVLDELHSFVLKKLI